jgi:hypothetical protein
MHFHHSVRGFLVGPSDSLQKGFYVVLLVERGIVSDLERKPPGVLSNYWSNGVNTDRLKSVQVVSIARADNWKEAMDEF